MAKLVDFTGGPQRQPLGGDFQRSMLLSELLRQKRAPVQSLGEGFANLGADALRAWGAKKAREREKAKAEERRKARVDNIRQSLNPITKETEVPGSAFGFPFGINPQLGAGSQPISEDEQSYRDGQAEFDRGHKKTPQNRGVDAFPRETRTGPSEIPLAGSNGSLIERLFYRDAGNRPLPTRIESMDEVNNRAREMLNEDRNAQGLPLLPPLDRTPSPDATARNFQTSSRPKTYQERADVLFENPDNFLLAMQTLDRGRTREQSLSDLSASNQRTDKLDQQKQRREIQAVIDSQKFKTSERVAGQEYRADEAKLVRGEKRSDFETQRENALVDYKKQLVIKAEMGKQEGFKEDPEKLRKEFVAINKDFLSSRDSYSRVLSSADSPSAAGDLALIFNYMKVLDPGSVVRESEFATAAASGSFGERIKAAMGKVSTGERLSPVMRNDFVNRAGKLFQSQLDIYAKTRETFMGVAERGGLTGESSVIDLTAGVGVKPEDPQGGATGAGATGGGGVKPEIPASVQNMINNGELDEVYEKGGVLYGRKGGKRFELRKRQ